MIKKTFAIDDEIAQLYEVAFLERKTEKGETYTNGMFFADMLYSFLNPKAKAVDNPAHLDAIQTLETQLSELHQTYLSNRESIYSLLTELHQNDVTLLPEADQSIGILLEYLRNTVVSLKETTPQTIEIQKELSPDEILLQLPEPARTLLHTTAERLSKRYKKNVTPGDVLLDCFVRYSVEQFQEWFFPFVIKPGEMQTLTGYSHNQLLNWLHKK